MQTTGIPSSHPVSPRNTADNSSSKNAHITERFSEAMHRALTGVDAQSHQQKNLRSAAAEEPAHESKSNSPDEISADKKRATAKKNSEHQASQFLGMAGATATPQRSPALKTGDTDNSDGV